MTLATTYQIVDPIAVEAMLLLANADEDEKGQYVIGGEKAEFLLNGKDDLVVRDGTLYYVNGEPKSLLSLVRTFQANRFSHELGETHG